VKEIAKGIVNVRSDEILCCGKRERREGERRKELLDDERRILVSR